MDSKDKKTALLQLLRTQSGSISLHDLLLLLGEGFAERSVRRWLDELVDLNIVEKIGKKRGTKYRVVNQTIFSPKSLLILKQIQIPLYERDIVTYKDDWVDSYEPNSTYYIPLHFRAQLIKQGKRLALKDPAGTYAH